MYVIQDNIFVIKYNLYQWNKECNSYLPIMQGYVLARKVKYINFW